MRTYSPIPNLTGIISDDYLYYEGMHRPTAFFTVRDGERFTKEKWIELERYRNDLYNLFLRKLTTFMSSTGNDEDVLKLQALLQELIKTKKLIENANETDIMDR